MAANVKVLGLGAALNLVASGRRKYLRTRMTQDEFEKEFVNQIICGDALAVMKDWPDGCIDTIIQDPPYGLEFMGRDWDKLDSERIGFHKGHSTAGFKPGGTIPLPSTPSFGAQSRGKRCLACGKYAGGNDKINCRCKYPAFVNVSRGSEQQEWHYQWATEALRVAKPGAIMLAFGGTRTFHRLTCAIEDAGWEIRDCMMWLYGSGFPKSLDISKAIDKAKGVEREVVGKKRVTRILDPETLRKDNYTVGASATGGDIPVSSPATDLAKLWDGWGTALKPAWEPIIVAMKPCEGTFAQNAEKHGVAGLWIDGGRIGTNPGYKYNADKNGTTFHGEQGNRLKQTAEKKGQQFIESTKGRWPANVILDEQAGAMLDEQSGMSNHKGHFPKQEHHLDSGGASRFFYCAKASRSERGEGNNHPTVKPLALMEYLCRLTMTPAGGIVLDMFGGSGTTALACIKTGRKYIVIDNKPEYCEIARRRVQEAQVGQARLPFES